MARKSTIRLLLINASDNESERLVSLFRAAGRVARAHRLKDADDLQVQLSKSANPLDDWDLLIADDNHTALDVESCLQFLQQKRLPLPVIVERSDANLPALLDAGAHDVVAAGDEQRLMFSALRALEATELRRRLLTVSTQLREAEQRNDLLLGDAAEAIAYITDGMIINANALFAERFGYRAADDLDCLPIVDLIAPEDQEKFKNGLKSGDGAEFACRGLTAGGEAFTAQLRLGSAVVDGEPCLQITLQEPAPIAGGSEINSDSDPESGLYSLPFLCRQASGDSCLALVVIDGFDSLRHRHGLMSSRQIAAEVGHFLGTQHPFAPQTVSARAGDDAFALLIPGLTAEAALAPARDLVAAIAEHSFSAGDTRLRLTVSIGLADTRADTGIEHTLDRSWRAVEVLRERADTGGVGNDALAAVPEQVRNLAENPEEMLQEALDDQRFVLLFQPVISLRGAKGEHYEVLLRMRHGDEIGLPDNFIAGLGQSSANARLDRWVLLEATKRLSENRTQGNDTRLLINLSANALLDDTLPTWLGVALKAAGIPASALILQLRETDMVSNVVAAKTFADAVHELGCKLSLSSFGRGADAQQTLRSLPVDMVQLDGSFTRELQSGNGSDELREKVSAISTQGVRVVIPFVENASVLASLWQAGADFIQGHYLQPPTQEMNYEFADIA